jgi:hypothetical protein
MLGGGYMMARMEFKRAEVIPFSVLKMKIGLDKGVVACAWHGRCQCAGHAMVFSKLG